jgi:hypothetical protein
VRQAALRPLPRTLGNTKEFLRFGATSSRNRSRCRGKCQCLKHLATQEQPSVSQGRRTCSKPSAPEALACLAIRGENAGNPGCPPAWLPGTQVPKPPMAHQMVKVAGTEMPQVLRCLRSASSRSNSPVGPLAPSRFCHLLAQPCSPNHSVKGTCLRQAPYVER